MNTETITEKLHQKADKELKARISKVFESARDAIRDGSCKQITVKGGYIQGEDNGSKNYFVDAFDAIEQLEKLSFEMQCDRNRENAVSEFMSRVEQLGQEIDGLRSELMG